MSKPEKSIRVNLLTPDGPLFRGNAQSIELPGVLGRFTILPRHAPILAALSTGKVRIKETDGKEQIFEISEGFVQFSRNEANLLVITKDQKQ